MSQESAVISLLCLYHVSFSLTALNTICALMTPIYISIHILGLVPECLSVRSGISNRHSDLIIIIIIKNCNFIPNFQLLRPQTLESFLTPFQFPTSPHSIQEQILSALPSKYISSLSTSFHFHCYYLPQTPSPFIWTPNWIPCFCPWPLHSTMKLILSKYVSPYHSFS